MVIITAMSPSEMEAMAGLLQLQAGGGDQSVPTPQPQAPPQVGNVKRIENDFVQVASAAWILSNCFNRTQEDIADKEPLLFGGSPSKCCDRCSTRCCNEFYGCIQKIQTRDVASQTDTSFDELTGELTDASFENYSTLEPRQSVQTRPNRKRKALTVTKVSSASIPVTPEYIRPALSPVYNMPPAVNTKTPILTKKSRLLQSQNYIKSPDYDREGLIGSDEEWQPTDIVKKHIKRRYTTSGSNKENMNVSGTSELDDTADEQLTVKSEKDLVPIGTGAAKVPGRLLKHMNWGSYTNATRKLLTAVFPRSVLATHSLTGKPSPAFPNKPAKKKLDSALVDDIVHTVVERCGVPESVVRTSITTKCADESKMFRTRQRNKKTR